MQFVAFETFASAYLFQIAWEKSFDYLLIIYKWQFLSCFSILRDKWRVKLLQLYWIKNLTCEFKRKNSFTLSKSSMKTKQFLLTVKSSFVFTVQLKNLTRKQRKPPCGFDAVFFTTVFRVVERLCVVFKFIFAVEKRSNPAQVVLTRIQRNKAKLYQETDLLSTETQLLTLPGCFPTSSSSLQVVQVRFAFVTFCFWTILSNL